MKNSRVVVANINNYENLEEKTKQKVVPQRQGMRSWLERILRSRRGLKEEIELDEDLEELDADKNIEVANIMEEIGIYEEDKDCME